jgi:hypothetical protein
MDKKMIKNNKFLSLILIFGVFSISLINVHRSSLAQSHTHEDPPTIPYQVYGLARLNGEFAPEGTIVSALCSEIVVAETFTIMSGGEAWYSLDIPPDDPLTSEKEGCISEEQIFFMINNNEAEQIAYWVAEGFDRLDLSAEGLFGVFLPIILK